MFINVFLILSICIICILYKMRFFAEEEKLNRKIEELHKIKTEIIKIEDDIHEMVYDKNIDTDSSESDKEENKDKKEKKKEKE